jgi:hypothetical protein
MTRTYIVIAALGLATAACGNSERTQTAQKDAAIEQPELMASAAAPGGVVPGGAVDVLQREGWRVVTVEQQADASTATGTPGQTG